MATQFDFVVAFLLGIVPALVLVWFSLRRFDKPRVEYSLFDDRRVFGSFAIGMIFGVVASVLTVGLPRTNPVEVILGLAGILLLEEAFKLVYLNRRGYRGRFDTTFTGLALGAGIAATATVASVYASGFSDFYLPQVLATFVLISLGLSLINITTGALLGFGASRGVTWRPLAQALGLRYLHTALLAPTGLPVSVEWQFLALVIATAFAFAMYRYVYVHVLPETLPEEMRRKVRRERRRAQAVKD